MVENVYSKEQEKRLKTSKILLFWSRFSMPLCKNLPMYMPKLGILYQMPQSDNVKI